MSAEIKPKYFLLVLIALAIFAAFFELGLRDVVEDNEGQRAAPPAEMLRSGQFVIPTLNGKDYLAKPPLIYWMIAASYTLSQSISPVWARTPTAFSFIVLVVAVYLYGRRSLGEMSGRLAALAVLSSPYILDRSRYAELDVPLVLATFLALIAAFEALRSKHLGRTLVLIIGGGLAFGAAILLKGPVPFLFLLCALLATLVSQGRSPEAWLRSVAPWTGGAFGLAVVLWLLGLVAPSLAHHVRFPLPLVIMVVIWFFYAWRYGNRPGHALVSFAAVAGIGIAVAAPWGIAVLAHKGLPYVMGLLQSEALERTHTATAINSGSPFYFLIGLLGMLAPWGLLLPTQASKEMWQEAQPDYRFYALTGWLSVLVFSLIAGKEYEYVLPAVPFLLLALGHQLALADMLQDWSGRWVDLWRKYAPPFLALLAIGFFVATLVKNNGVRLYADALLLCLIVLLVVWVAMRQREGAYTAVAIAALCTVLIWTLSQTYRYTGAKSPKDIAELTRALIKDNYDVEAAKMTSAFDVFPGFAFHAGCYVPTTTDPDHILSKLEGDEPYYCVVSEKMLEMYPKIPAQFTHPLFGPYTNKKLIIIGNQPLPDLRR